MEHSALYRMLEVATVAARLAGQRAMEDIKYTKSSIKNGNEMATQADSICQDIIVQRIKEAYPDHGFLAEEGKDGQMFKQPPRGSADIWWVIDPIDGTNNYAHGVLDFSVSIAALFEGKPIAAVVFAPATDQMFTAVSGGEPQLNSSRINCGQEELNSFSHVGMDNSIFSRYPEAASQVISSCRYRNLGSTALHLAYVASGGFVAMLNTDGRLWDIAAGILLVKMAGGKVQSVDGAEIFPVDLDAYDGSTYSLLAANSKVYPEISKMTGLAE